MTRQKHLKQRARARMEKTGEGYVAARRHVLNALPPRGYELCGGVHPETAAIANVLANRGLLAPHTGEPLGEAMVLGVGGGLGAGYILWEFERHDARVLALGFRNGWQYPDRWVAKTCARLGVPAALRETGSRKRAAADLRAALGEGAPAVAWVDMASLPYRHLPGFLKGRDGQPVVVYALDEAAGRALVDDRNRDPLSLSLEALEAARAQIPSYKNRLLVMDAPAAELDLARLRAAVLEGLREQVAHLGGASDSFSLPAWRKWARLMTDEGSAKGWPRVFAGGRGLFGVLASAYQGVAGIGPDGGDLRELYAAFLDEATGLLGLEGLRDVAEDFRSVAGLWRGVAEAALPEGVEPFSRARRLLEEGGRLHERGDAAVLEAETVSAQLWELRRRWRTEFPLGEAETRDLFGQLRSRLEVVYAAETAAIHRLRSVLPA